MDTEQTLHHIRDRTGMWVSPPTFRNAVSFIDGWNNGLQRGLLAGFRESLLVRSRATGGNLHWPAYALDAVFSTDRPSIDDLDRNEDLCRRAIVGVIDLILEYRALRQQPNGMRRIFLEHESWLHGKTWFNEHSPDWIDPPRLRKAARKHGAKKRRGPRS